MKLNFPKIKASITALPIGEVKDRKFRITVSTERKGDYFFVETTGTRNTSNQLQELFNILKPLENSKSNYV